jgi:hypothetical protein
MPLVDQELQEFHEVLAKIDEAELDLMLSTKAIHERAHKAEEAMRDYYARKGWVVYTPRGKTVTNPGPDAIIWRPSQKPGETLEMRIIDNKSGGGKRRTVTHPTGLSLRSFRAYLKGWIADLSRQTPPLRYADKAVALLKQIRLDAINCDGQLPPGVKLYVTNACGNWTNVDILHFPREAPDPTVDKRSQRRCPVVHFENINDDVVKRRCSSST